MSTDFLAALSIRNRYLNLLEAALTGSLHEDPSAASMLPTAGTYNRYVRAVGADWPRSAHTMIGHARMRNLRHVCEAAILNNIPGDFLEAGVWRGGPCILMRGILEAYGDTQRRVFVADSFKGLPPPNADEYPADEGSTFHTDAFLAVSRQEVEDNFRRYGLLDTRVVFLEGWFKDTLPAAPIERLSVLRVDGDMYESTMQVLESCCHKVSPGGAVIIDDYHVLEGCSQATDDFRTRHGISTPLLQIDNIGVWWIVD